MSAKDLSNKFMSISPEIVSFAKVFCHRFFAAETSSTTQSWFRNMQKNFSNVFSGILTSYISFFPTIRMIPPYVFSVIFHQFKIFYSIISLDMIQVVHSFVLFKFSPKMLLYYKPMFQNSFFSSIYTDIAKWTDTGLSFFKVSPIRRNLIVPVSKKSASVHCTNTTIIPFKDVVAVFNFANFSSSHNIIIA